MDIKSTKMNTLRTTERKCPCSPSATFRSCPTAICNALQDPSQSSSSFSRHALCSSSPLLSRSSSGCRILSLSNPSSKPQPHITLASLCVPQILEKRRTDLPTPPHLYLLLHLLPQVRYLHVPRVGVGLFSFQTLTQSLNLRILLALASLCFPQILVKRRIELPILAHRFLFLQLVPQVRHLHDPRTGAGFFIFQTLHQSLDLHIPLSCLCVQHTLVKLCSPFPIPLLFSLLFSLFLHSVLFIVQSPPFPTSFWACDSIRF
mmetsp:Transcript_1961/g.5233  ORF Transcript_1961/g.5233 Transcript_1961/m.5233 type:complete len:261 (+) Transcript_1961:61-843(+)